MAERDDKDIEIKDLPPEETLTPEEKERLAGAGRVRPMFEVLEARDMMSVMTPMTPSADMTPSQPANVRILTVKESANVEMVSGVKNTPEKYGGASDASAAVEVTWQYKNETTARKGVLVGDDKSDVIRLYTTQGEFVAMYNLGKEFNAPTSFTGTSGTTSSDIEAAARVGDTIYWMTSSAKVFVTRITENQFEYVKEVNLRPALEKAGETINVYANGQPMTLAAAMKKSQGSTDDAKNYFNIEGFAIRPNEDGTLTAYIGFRAPLMGSSGKALLLPVTNFKDAMENGTTASFGDPIRLNLQGPDNQGRGIRDIVWCQEAGPNKSGMFVILAGSYGVGPTLTQSSLIYAWNGQAESTDGKLVGSPVMLSVVGLESGERTAEGRHLADNARDKWMSIEAIGQISVDMDGNILSVQVLADDGGTSHGKKDTNNQINPFSKRYFWGEVYEVPADTVKAAADHANAGLAAGGA